MQKDIMSVQGNKVPRIAWLDRMTTALAHLAGALNVLILTAMTCVVFVSVIARYAFNSGLPWSEEFAIWGFTWLIFIGVALGVRGNRHVSVELVLDLMPPSERRVMVYIRDCLFALAILALTFSGYKLTNMVGGVSTSLFWPNALRYAVIPGAGLLALVFFVFAMLLGVTMTTWDGGLLPAPAIVQNMVAGSSKFILLAIPFFLTTGYLLNIGGLSTRLIDFAASIFGHMRGGLAQVNVFNSVLIGGISGSSGADAASTTKVLVPQMVKRGYSTEFSCAVTAVSSILPNVLPPAIAMLVYASVANVSIAKLFVGGIVPGLLIAAVLMTINAIIARRRGYEEGTTRAPCSTVWRTLVRALPALAIAVVVLGCIRLGITTATEAGVIALVWALVLGKFIFRECTWKELYISLKDCSVDSALIGFLIAASVPFAWILIAEGLPQEMISNARSFNFGPVGMTLVLVTALFVAGMFLDLTPAILIAAPLFLPLMLNANFDPVQVGIIMIINLQLGGVTPPVGILVFITAQISRIAPQAVFREVIPFVLAVVFVLALVCVFPILSLGLWSLIG